MLKTLGHNWRLVRMVVTFSLVCLVSASFFNVYLLAFANELGRQKTLARNQEAQNRVQAPLVAEDWAGLFQDFDIPGVGAPYTTGVYVTGPGPALLPGGPANDGRFFRLAYADPIPSHTGLTFARTSPGAFDQILIDFALRIKPGSGRADGLGVTLLNTANYGTTGDVPPEAPLFAAEEPNFLGSVGLGFDIFQSSVLSQTELNNNHVSVHFNGALLQEFDAAPLDLASGEWLFTRIILRPGGGHSDVTVLLTRCGESVRTIVDQVKIAGLAPYEGRIHLAARSGGESGDHDVDDLRVHFLRLGQDAPQFRPICHHTLANDFDNPAVGAPYLLGTHVAPPAPQAQLLAGGPTDQGQFMRLAFAGATPDQVPNQNSLVFTPTNPPADQVVVDFDFRIKPGRGLGDGLGVSLLNIAHYNSAAAIPPEEPFFAAEEPNFRDSLGIGFDLNQASDRVEAAGNHVTLHFNKEPKTEKDAAPHVDLAAGQWVHARLILRPDASHTDATVILTPCGKPSATIIDKFKVTGFTPYQSYLHFAARAGGQTADHDIDNVRAHFGELSQSFLAFDTGCYAALERDQAVTLIVARSGSNLNSLVTVAYNTADGSAIQGVDYQPIFGALAFAPGEITKTLRVPLVEDTQREGDESFLLFLSNPTGASVLGGPAIAKVTIHDNEAGAWSEAIPLPVVPIHLHLLPTGKVLFWDRHDVQRGWDGAPRLWDPATGAITELAEVNYDLFCAGHAFLPDGTLLITGGHVADGVGEDKAILYNPFTNQWTPLTKMNLGRWYPSNVTLANGDMLVMGGTYTNTAGISGVNPLPQVWEAATGQWRDLTSARQGDTPAWADYYPFLYLAPNGKVFVAGPQQAARYLDTSGTGSWSVVATSTISYRDYGSSVMYDEGKVLIVGGNPREPNPNAPPTILPSASAEIIDLKAANPTWQTVTPMHKGRRHLNATLLPDGKVLVTGGSSLPGFDNPQGAVLEAELWDPETKVWTLLAAQGRYRGYHSTALLLPDGRVLVGGGGHPDPVGGAQPNFEIFSPPYLLQGERPTIVSAPASVAVGEQFFIETTDAAKINHVHWLRLPSVTHAFDQNQRFNRLQFTKTANGLMVTAPADPNLAPPGHYMLFILDAQGTPSVARIIQLRPATAKTGKIYFPIMYSAITARNCVFEPCDVWPLP